MYNIVSKLELIPEQYEKVESFERSIKKFDDGRMSIWYRLTTNDGSSFIIPMPLSREYIEELKFNKFAWEMLEKTLERNDKILYRELRLKKILNERKIDRDN